MNILKWLGYFILLGLFIWFVFFRNYSFNQASKQTIDQEIENLENNDIDEPILGDDTSFVDEVDNAEEEFSENDNNSESTNICLNKKYLIVVGSFGNIKNAERLLNRVKMNGNNGTIKNINGLNRVITASTNDEGDAKNLKEHFTNIFKERAFILEN